MKKSDLECLEELVGFKILSDKTKSKQFSLNNELANLNYLINRAPVSFFQWHKRRREVIEELKSLKVNNEKTFSD